MIERRKKFVAAEKARYAEDLDRYLGIFATEEDDQRLTELIGNTVREVKDYLRSEGFEPPPF